ncbi:MAG: helicase-related protein, partial [Ruminococcus bromii]|nr:helicase-related protein [Ruminococcus bromii]
YFNNRIAAEIRLPEAIDRKLLSPFQYFGVTDSIDLDKLKWAAGGYDKSELSKIYTINGAASTMRADLVVRSLLKYVTDIDDVKGLGFCVSIEHAKFMSNYFNQQGIPSIYLTGKSADDERKNAKQLLISGEIRFIFVVDIYNEGVDIPEVNTILFLRPTESLTVFLQQLGRGLRLAENKECLTVLDFIGQANRKYNFEDKFAALLSNTTRGVTREIKDGFISLPKGCYVQLEKKAAKYILENIRSSYGNTAGLIAKIAAFEEDTGLALTLANFLHYHHLDPRNIYKFDSFSRLCARADVIDNFDEPAEETLKKAFVRLVSIDSRRWIKFLLTVLPKLSSLDVSKLSNIEQRMMQMFYVSVFLKTVEDWNVPEVADNMKMLSDSTVMLHELTELLRYKLDKIDFIDKP